MRLFHSWFQEEHKIAEPLKPLVGRELKKLGLPKNVGELEKLNEAYMQDNSKSLTHLLQYLKVKAKVLGKALAATDVEKSVTVLKDDAKKQFRIEIAEKLFKILPTADAFKKASSQEFKYATAFKEAEE